MIGTPSSRSTYQRVSCWLSMSAESPVTTAAASGAPVTWLMRRSEMLVTIAAATWVVSVSWGWNALAQVEWFCAIIGSSRAGLCASIRCMSDRCPM